ncbi:MAG: hypothetical protein M1831_002248 [Alyxoria varia]|nr:MAG: hypothetical protein M1831_002248 [Alyxoria varia]
MSAALNSDHVNYLIWRYLQERGYGKSAIQLSREWGIEKPQQLPFAEAVKPHTLISMLQDGLAYDSISASVSHNVRNSASQSADNDSARANNKRYKFMDSSKKRRHSESPSTESQQPNGVGMTGPRKRQKIDFKTSEANGDAASRSPTSHHERRKSSKAANLSVQTDHSSLDPNMEGPVVTAPARSQRDGAEPGSAQDMEVDVPEEPPQPPPPPPAPPLPSTLDLGICAGTQTQYIEIDRSAKTIADLGEPGMDAMHVRWEDGGVGRITLYGYSTWQSLDVSEADKAMETVNDEPLRKLEPNTMRPNSDSYFVSAVASSKSGGGTYQLATVIEENGEDPCMTLQICCGSDLHMDNLPVDHGPVTLLKFNPASTLLLASRTNGRFHTLCLLASSDVNDGDASAEHVDCNVQVKTKAPDLVLALEWLTDDTFVCCGLGHFQIYRVHKPQDVVPSQIEPSSAVEESKDSDITKEPQASEAGSTERITHKRGEKEESPAPPPSNYTISLVKDVGTTQNWTSIAYDSILNQVACISEDPGLLGLVQLDSYELHTKVAHEDIITSVQWQPRPLGVKSLADHASDAEPNQADHIAHDQIADTTMTDAPQEGQEIHAEASTDSTEPTKTENEPIDTAPSAPQTAITTSKPATPQPTTTASKPSTPQPHHHDARPTLRLLATSCIDGTLKLWNAPAGFGTLQCLRTFHVASHSLTPCISLNFRPDGEYVAAAGDRSIRVWRIPGNIEIGEARDFRLLEEERRRLCVVEWEGGAEVGGTVGRVEETVNEAETGGVEANAPEVQRQQQQNEDGEAVERDGDGDSMALDGGEDTSNATAAQPRDMPNGENGTGDVEMKQEGRDESSELIVGEPHQQQENNPDDRMGNGRATTTASIAEGEDENKDDSTTAVAAADPAAATHEPNADDDAQVQSRNDDDDDEDDGYHTLLWDPTGTYLAYSGNTKFTLIKPNNVPPMTSSSSTTAEQEQSEQTAAPPNADADTVAEPDAAADTADTAVADGTTTTTVDAAESAEPAQEPRPSDQEEAPLPPDEPPHEQDQPPEQHGNTQQGPEDDVNAATAPSAHDAQPRVGEPVDAELDVKKRDDVLELANTQEGERDADGDADGDADEEAMDVDAPAPAFAPALDQPGEGERVMRQEDVQEQMQEGKGDARASEGRNA